MNNLLKKKFILGCAQFGTPYGILNKKKIKPKFKEIQKIFNFLHDRKIYEIDTAEDYNFKFKNLKKIKNFKIHTKLKKKNIDKFSYDCVYIHDGDNFFSKKNQDIYYKIVKLKKKGLIKKIGISIYNFENLNKILKNYSFDIIQAPYSIYDRRIEKYFNLIKKNGLKIYVRSIFLQGLLLENIFYINKYFFKWKKNIIEFDRFSKYLNIKKLYLCINFVLSKKQVDKVILGVQNLKQIKEIFKYSLRKKIDYKSIEQIKDKNLIIPSNWQLK